MIKAAVGGNAIATEMLRRAYPRSLRTPIPPDRVATATVRGIERRSARIIVPRRWIPFSVVRGLVNPLFDRSIEHDPEFRQLVLKLEQQAIDLRDQTAHNGVSLTRENGAAVPS